jgi:hypothetical protein
MALITVHVYCGVEVGGMTGSRTTYGVTVEFWSVLHAVRNRAMPKKSSPKKIRFIII